MSSFRRNGKRLHQRAQEQADWVEWQTTNAWLLRESGLDWYALASRRELYALLAQGWWGSGLWRLDAGQRSSLRMLLATLVYDPEQMWPEFFSLPELRQTPEEQWLESSESSLAPEAICRATPRQLRLFAADCCRRLPRFGDLACEEPLMVIERYADGGADHSDLAWARQAADAAIAWARSNSDDPGVVAASLLKAAAQVHIRPHLNMFLALPDAHRTSWREFLGNPFRKQSRESRRREIARDAARLATAIYEERGFDGMPMLADALEETGCQVAEVLEHCRDRSIRHTRGCWALDWVCGHS